MLATPQKFEFGAPPPSELELKCFVLQELRNLDRRWATSTVSSEFRVGDTAVRADLALLGHEFLGVEIKSERDSLARLPKQIEIYKSYFDRVVLAVADCHLKHLDWAQLREVDVWRVNSNGRIDVVSERSRLPETLDHSALLTYAELRRVRQGATADEYQVAFFEAFVRRYQATSSKFWAEVQGRKIEPTDIGLLSPFKEQRATAHSWSLKQQEGWSRWNASLEKMAGV